MIESNDLIFDIRKENQLKQKKKEEEEKAKAVRRVSASKCPPDASDLTFSLSLVCQSTSCIISILGTQLSTRATISGAHRYEFHQFQFTK